MLLVGTAPEGGEDIMQLEEPELKRVLEDPNLQGLQVLVKLFFAPSDSSQAAGQGFRREPVTLSSPVLSSPSESGHARECC